MSCSVAIASSPVFSPSRISISCKGSPETLSLNPSSSPSASPCSYSASSPLRSRFQRTAISLRAASGGFGGASSPSDLPSSPPLPPLGSSGSRSVLKRKRPARIDIPLTEGSPFEIEEVDGRREVQAESARYSVYCKRGKKRLEMEDRHKASLDLNGNPKLVGALLGLYLSYSSPRNFSCAKRKHSLRENFFLNFRFGV